MAVAPEDAFPGLAERTEAGTIRVFPRHPDWPGDPRTFDHLYELIREIRIPCVGPTPKTELIGLETPRQCAFCRRTDAKVTFRKESHVVPAGLGNRHVLSLEECDECNESFGAELDQQLVNYLAIDRVLAGVRKRAGSSIKLKAPDDTFLKYDHQKQRLVITTDTKRADAMTRMSGRTETTFDIIAYGASYSFDHVVRELVRLTWMCLRAEHRLSSPEYLELTKGVRTPTAWQIFKTFVPAAPRVVTLRVWRARKPCPDVPVTITSFIVGHTGLIWASCDGEMLTYRPGPLPAFQFDPTFGNPVLRMIIEAPGAKHAAKPETITFGHRGLVDGEGVEPPTTLRQKPPRPVRDVELRWVQDGVERRIVTGLDIHRYDDRVQRLKIGGIEFGAYLVVHHESGATSCTPTIDLSHQPITLALATVQVLTAMSPSGPGVMVFIDDQPIFHLANLEGHELDLDNLQRKLAALAELAGDLGVDLTVPTSDDRASWETLDALTIARRDGAVSITPFSVKLPLDEALHVKQLLVDTDENIALPWQVNWQIDGIALPVGPSYLVISAPYSATLTTIESTKEASLKLSDRAYLCKFERWSRSA